MISHNNSTRIGGADFTHAGTGVAPARELRMQLTAERLRELLNFDPQTGIFTRRLVRRGAPPAGSIAGYRTKHGYIRMELDGVVHYAHRLVWLWLHGEWPRFEIDHRNGDRTDNRPANLRDVPREINLQNLRKARCTSISGMLGVSRSRCGRKWIARVKTRGVVSRLGPFETADQAHAAYVAAKREDHEGCTL